MKSWKKRWKDELDNITPDLSEEVKNAPFHTTHSVCNNGGDTAVIVRKNTTLISLIAVIVVLVICVTILCVCLIKSSDSHNVLLFTLEINPTITLSTDEKGIVTGVMASNADADVIFADENVVDYIKGKSIAEAVTYCTDYASKLGFIDLENDGSAVRISGLANDDILTEAKAALENYFVKKGIFAVVITETVDKEEFCSRSGIDDELPWENVAKFISESDVRFSERKVRGLNLQELQSLYNDVVIKGPLFDFVSGSLESNIERIVNNAQDIQTLSQLYYDIFNHNDNPLKPLGDYWMVKKLCGDVDSADFSALIVRMDDALVKYKNDYGIEITGVGQLNAAAESYIKIPAQDIAILLETFTFDDFVEFYSDITEILKITGLIEKDFADFMQLPQSTEEYLEKTVAVYQSEYQTRMKNYESVYNKNRLPIDKVKYDEFIENIIENYGSLDAYWRTIKNY